MAREDFRQGLTHRLIQSIEQTGCFPWNQNERVILTRPFNPAIKSVFKGGNALNLMMGALEKGYDDPRWMKLDHANALGCRVRKGAKAVYAEYWDWEKNASDIAVPRVSYVPLFNGCDIEGLPELNRRAEWTPEALARTLIEETGISIVHGPVDKEGVRTGRYEAFFSNADNKVVLPAFESFQCGALYYVEVMHHLAEWAGYSSGLFNDEAEKTQPEMLIKRALRSELATAFLIARLGLYGTVKTKLSDPHDYIKVLKADKHEIFRAAKDSEKLVEVILEFAHEARSRIDGRIQDNHLLKPQMDIFPGNESETKTAELAKSVSSDPRWITFTYTVRSEAERFGIELGTLEKTLSLVESSFSQVMEAAGRKGYSSEDMNSMLVRSIVEEMKTIDERQTKWNKFCEQVMNVNARELRLPQESVESALSELGFRYQSLLIQSSQNRWDKEHTDQAIRDMVYGEEGRRPIDKHYVVALLNNARKAEELPAVLHEEEFYLKPFGIGMETDFMPDNSVELGV